MSRGTDISTPNFIDEYRARSSTERIVEKIHAVSTKKITVMEICGTHTHSIAKYGIRGSLPSNITLISGPGCPVCVTATPDIDSVIDFARTRPDVILATFGDMMRVPGTSSTLAEAKADGADVRVVYSPLNVIDFALNEPDKEVLLFAVGFETTAPTVAATIKAAKAKGLKNLSVLALHKLTPPAMRALMDSGNVHIDGFICPGHVTAITGSSAYAFLADEYNTPCVVAGFEPVDLLLGIYMLVKQIEENRREIEIEYSRIVRPEGNRKAQQIVKEVFTPTDALWRGLGTIPDSGLKINKSYLEFDAVRRFDFTRGPTPESRAEPDGCDCGGVLKGVITPPECALFAGVCTPENPVGPCMVSSEGTCAAYYRYKSL